MRRAPHTTSQRWTREVLLFGGFAILALALLAGCAGDVSPEAEDQQANVSEMTPEKPFDARQVQPASTALPATKPAVALQPTPATQPKPAPRPDATKPLRRAKLKFVGAGPVDVEWTNTFGKGGVRVPALLARQKPMPCFSRLTGVVFGPAGEIHFLGVRERGKPLLECSALLDAFVLAYRGRVTGAHPLGVTIDPTSDQVTKGLREGDPMQVIYLGGAERSVVGQDSCRGDLDMKNLGSGVDNVTRKPIVCAVPGYKSVLDLRAARPGGRKQSWHRFWLEPARNVVRQSKDGLTFLLDTQLHARTEYMVSRGGKLIPGKATADPSAETFVTHLSKSFEAFGDEFPAFRRLTAYAQLCSLAEAVRPASARTDERVRPSLDQAWLLDGHRPQQVSTDTTTPAIIVSKTVAVPAGGTSKLSQQGGVNLGPDKNVYRIGDAGAEAVGPAVLAEAKRRPGQVNWPVRVGETDYQVWTHRPNSMPMTWQIDLKVGDVTLARDYPVADAAVPIGTSWGLRLPQISFSTATVRLQGREGRLPRAVHVREGSAVVTLDTMGQLTLPGQPQTLAYLSRDGQRRLLVYRNELLYLDGKIDFVSRPGEEPVMRIPVGSRVIRFFGEAPHRIREVRTSTGRLEYEYKDSRLIAVRDGAGNEARLIYDEQGRLTALEDVKSKRRIEYRRTRGGRLRAVVDKDGQAISYVHDRTSGDLLWVCADSPAGGLEQALTTDQVSYFVAPTRSEVREAAARLAGVIVIRCIREAPAGSDKPVYEIDMGDGSKINVDPDKFDEQTSRLLAPAATADQKKEANQALRQLLGKAAEGDAPILLVGHHVDEFALAFGQLGLPKFVGYGVNLDLALENYRARLDKESSTEVVIDKQTWLKQGNVVCCKAGLLTSEVKALEKTLASLREPVLPGVVVIVGEHNRAFEKEVRKLPAEFLKGKTVVFLTCGTLDSHALAGDALYQPKATGVSYFARHIHRALLPVLVGRLHTELAEESNNANSHDAVRRAMRRVREELLKQAEKGEFPPGIAPRLGDDSTPLPGKVEEFKKMLAPLEVQLQRLSRRPSLAEPGKVVLGA